MSPRSLTAVRTTAPRPLPRQGSGAPPHFTHSLLRGVHEEVSEPLALTGATSRIAQGSLGELLTAPAPPSSARGSHSGAASEPPPHLPQCPAGLDVEADVSRSRPDPGGRGLLVGNADSRETPHARNTFVQGGPGGCGALESLTWALSSGQQGPL